MTRRFQKAVLVLALSGTGLAAQAMGLLDAYKADHTRCACGARGRA